MFRTKLYSALGKHCDLINEMLTHHIIQTTTMSSSNDADLDDSDLWGEFVEYLRQQKRPFTAKNTEEFQKFKENRNPGMKEAIPYEKKVEEDGIYKDEEGKWMTDEIPTTINESLIPPVQMASPNISAQAHSRPVTTEQAPVSPKASVDASHPYQGGDCEYCYNYR
jgi:hypothetical protein